MDPIFKKTLSLIRSDQVRISDHGYEELAEDDLFASQILGGAAYARILEPYPTFPKGPCVLVLQADEQGRPIHVLWGIPKNKETPAVLITAYRPDPSLWTDGFSRRRK